MVKPSLYENMLSYFGLWPKKFYYFLELENFIFTPNFSGSALNTQIAYRNASSKITVVKYTLILNIMTSIGGFFSFMSALILTLISLAIKG